jgi:hypothetical protein
MDAPIRSETAEERRLVEKLLASLERANGLSKDLKKAAAIQNDPALSESAAAARRRVKKALKATLALQEAWDFKIESAE